MPPKKVVSELSSDMKNLIRSEVTEGLQQAVLAEPFLQSLASAVFDIVSKKLEESMIFNQDLISGLRKELSDRNKEVEELKRRLDERTDELEMYTRRNSLRIFGVDESDREDTDQLVLEVASKISVPLALCDIDRCHRVGPKTFGKTRPLIVKFVSYRKRRELFYAKRRLKGQPITIREDLTRARLEVYREAVRRFQTRNVWTEDGTIVICRVEVSKTRWKSLRTSYLRHCKLLACRRKESTKCRKWPLADELSFLNPYLVPTDCITGSNGVEEPEPLSEDAWARVYDDVKPSGPAALLPPPPPLQPQQPQPMEGVVGVDEEEEEEEEVEEDDDEIEEIIEHPPVEELREAFAAASDSTEGVRGGRAGSEGSLSSYITLVEPDSAVSRSDRRPSSRPSTGGGGGRGGGGSGSPLRTSHHHGDDDTHPRHHRDQRDTTRDFFLYLAETVKTFPPYLQAQVKGKCFEAVNSAELSVMAPNGRGGNATPKR